MSTKLVIEVHRGAISQIFSSDENTDVFILDHDLPHAELALYAEAEELKKNLYEVYRH